MTTIVDYKVGNIASVINMLHSIGEPCGISQIADDILRSDRVILPGVGAFDSAMEKLQAFHLTEAIVQFVKTGRPLLGICLGSQLLMDSSEEGELEGLSLIPGNCVRFQSSDHLTVPHMGWADVNFMQKHLIARFDNDPRFYFAHSYFIKCSKEEYVLGTSEYGNEFASAVVRDNVIGVQFHPEKSHKFGLQLFQNFIEI